LEKFRMARIYYLQIKTLEGKIHNKGTDDGPVFIENMEMYFGLMEKIDYSIGGVSPLK
jgi:hypothetical protein